MTASDPLWPYLDNVNHRFTREQLEIVIQKKKLNEIHYWFQEHFISCDRREYISRCPIVILQGSTGCGKSSVLRYISQDLNIPIKDYGETTDLTSINYDFAARRSSLFDDDDDNACMSIDRRRALKFEQFVINNVRYDSTQLFSNQPGFGNSQSFRVPTQTSQGARSQSMSMPQKFNKGSKGIIIHVESPLAFIRSQKILIQTMCRLVKINKEIAKRSPRRLAIVFESLDGENQSLSLPTKMRISFGIQVFKFNPIIKANMKRLVDNLMRNYNNVLIDKDTIEQLIDDCDGDMRACIKTLQLICNNCSLDLDFQNEINRASIDRSLKNNMTALNWPANKRQKVNHMKFNTISLTPSMMRDTSRSLSFFHVLGKIFYQKRLYPMMSPYGSTKHSQVRPIDRPFPPENSTDHLLNLIDVGPENLIAWLHQHYYKFCNESNIFKAALFLENISEVDAISTSSFQSSQFYEYHHIMDQLQIYLAIESTVYSLYESNLNTQKSSHKKILTKSGYKIVKSSVENFSSGSEPNGDLYSFKKPTVIPLRKLIQDYQKLLNFCSSSLHNFNPSHNDANKILIDYLPYMKIISKNWQTMSPDMRNNYYPSTISHPIFDDEAILDTLDTLESMSDSGIDSDIAESRQDKLLEIIEKIEIIKSSQDSGSNQLQ